jgi:hypothetical protein
MARVGMARVGDAALPRPEQGRRAVVRLRCPTCDGRLTYQPPARE